MFGAISMPLPELRVQKKIAQILNCISKEIDIQCKLVELYQIQKKGLMQKLLTGQIRVKV
jgi:type I restriction enzyme S subunit